MLLLQAAAVQPSGSLMAATLFGVLAAVAIMAQFAVRGWLSRTILASALIGAIIGMVHNIATA